MSPKYYLALTSDAALAPSDSQSHTHRIVDHGTWLDIDGVPVEKRIAADPSHAMYRVLRDEITDQIKLLREKGVKAGNLAVKEILDKAMREVLTGREEKTATVDHTVLKIMKTAERDKRTIDNLNRKHSPFR